MLLKSKDMMKRSFVFIVLMSILNPTRLHSQTEATVDSTQVRNKNILKRFKEYLENTNEIDHNKKFDVSFVGGPHYSSDNKLGLGLVASGLYRLDRSDLSISPSNVSLYGDFTTTGGVVLGVSNNTIFPDDKYRLDLDVFFFSRPSKYWGIGYDCARQKHNYTKYTKREMLLKGDFLRKTPHNIYAGVTATVQHIKGDRIKDISFLHGENKSNTAIGGGVLVGYDSRDFIPNPYKGYYIKLEQNFYPSFLGSTHTFSRTHIVFRHYRPVWKGGILAYDLEGLFNNGNVPWSMMALIGNSTQMRGYFNGQYRDKKLIQTQIELRQKIYGRSGAVIWTGAGNCFSEFDQLEFSQTLPTVGMGYRWEFKNRINVRLDYGIGKGQTGFYFQINEAF